MRSVFFYQMHVEHMQIGSYRYNKSLFLCKSLFLFASDIYVTNVHFKSILEPYKCQIVKYFLGLFSEPHWRGERGGFRAGPQTPPVPKLGNSQLASNGPSWAILAHTLPDQLIGFLRLSYSLLFPNWSHQKRFIFVCKEMNLKIEPPPHKQILRKYTNKNLGQWEECFQIKL